jgi:hypothetical protein
MVKYKFKVVPWHNCEYKSVWYLLMTPMDDEDNWEVLNSYPSKDLADEAKEREERKEKLCRIIESPTKGESMSKEKAIDYLKKQVGRKKIKTVYDNDTMVYDVLQVLMPDFEYPEVDWLTGNQIAKRFE